MAEEGKSPVNVLLVDDQPGKLLSYQAILEVLGENLLTATSARDALDTLLRNDVAVVLMDVCMPEIDGFELAAMISEHPRCRNTALIFVSGVHLSDIDRLKAYGLGAVDYVTVPIVPEILRAKVSVFARLHRTTRELERLNRELEARVAERTEELVRSNDALRQREERLREADRRKDEFLATLAHELRNPLAPIRSAAELLRMDQVGDAQRTRAMDVIDRQVSHMVRLIDDLMDVTRIATGRLVIKREVVDLRELVSRAIELTRPRIDAQRLRLTAALPEAPVNAEVDATRIVQAIGNLLDNAAKHTDAEGTIELELRTEADDVVLRVQDDGAGIDPEMLPNVFELFAQARPGPGRQSGLGVGLALVRRIVELHGGTVTADSRGTGHGSSFVVRLHGCLADTPEPAAVSALQQKPNASERLKIVVADDDPDIAETLTWLLETAGHEVRACHDGRQAVELAESLRPNAVLLDIGMPVMDGLDAARAIRSAPWGREMVLIAISGWGQSRDRERTREAGFDEHCVKPVDGAKLLALLSSLSRRESARELAR
jgi:signal transduction histidine kinase